MIKTIQRSKKQISNLSHDIEIVNPIESKSLFGGCDYCADGYAHSGGWLDGVTVSNYNSPNNSFGNYYGSNNTLNGGYGSDWNNYGGDYGGSGSSSSGNGDSSWSDSNGDGIHDEDMQKIYDSYPGDLSAPEALWLYLHIASVPEMINNKNIAFQYGQGHNGIGDALRHALWSALDAFDIGSENAHEFHTLHEQANWDDTESPSDLHNNGWGYNWAILNGDPEQNMNQFLSDFNTAVANGHIDIIP